MSEHDVDERLRSWARSPSGRPTPADLRKQVLDIPTTEPVTQRRRWLRFLPDRRPTAGANGREDRTRRSASDTTVNGGPLPAPTGGTRTMLSATKLVGIAAAVALFGALALAGPLSPPEEVQEPAAPAFEPGEITLYTGTIRILGQDNVGTYERFDWGVDREGEQSTVRYESTDPRLSGVSTGHHNVYEVIDYGESTVERVTQLRAYKARLFTKEGSWLETGRGYVDPETAGLQLQIHMVGEGPYEGLFAVSSCGQAGPYSVFDCEGAVFSGGLPELPADAPTEIPPAHLEP